MQFVFDDSNMQNTATDCVDKMHGCVCYTQ